MTTIAMMRGLRRDAGALSAGRGLAAAGSGGLSATFGEALMVLFFGFREGQIANGGEGKVGDVARETIDEGVPTEQFGRDRLNHGAVLPVEYALAEHAGRQILELFGVETLVAQLLQQCGEPAAVRAKNLVD